MSTNQNNTSNSNPQSGLESTVKSDAIRKNRLTISKEFFQKLDVRVNLFFLVTSMGSFAVALLFVNNIYNGMLNKIEILQIEQDRQATELFEMKNNLIKDIEANEGNIAATQDDITEIEKQLAIIINKVKP